MVLVILVDILKAAPLISKCLFGERSQRPLIYAQITTTLEKRTKISEINK